MKQAIVTIHGIHTGDLSTWQDSFRFFAKSLHPDVKIFNYEYGFMAAPFAWWATVCQQLNLPLWFRRFIIDRFSKKLIWLQKKFPEYEFSILAHSFGTWISYHALRKNPEIQIKNLILVGGVINQYQERTDIVDWLEVQRLYSIYAYWSHTDNVVGKMAIEPFGKLGYYGFIRHDHEEDLVRPLDMPYAPYRIYNREHEGHGGALRDTAKYGKQLLSDLLGDK